MSNVTTEIKVFPDKEMLALDMAEVLRSLALYNGAILQGCRFDTSLPGGKVIISSGRIFIRGRLAEVTGGEIPAPTDLSTAQTCYVVAVYDPDVTNPFYIDIFTSQQKDALDAVISQEFSDDDAFDLNFNVSSYKSYMTLATVTIAAGTGAASNLSVNQLNYPNKNNQSVFSNTINSNVTTLNNTINTKESALSTRINTTNTNLTNHNASNQAMYNYLKDRLHNKGGHGFKQQNITYPTVDIPAGGIVTASFRYGYDVTHSITINGSAATRSIGGLTGNPYLPEASFSPGQDSYGYPTSLDPRLYAIGISGIRFSDAAKGGGKNSNNCVLAGYYFEADSPYRCFVKIRNVGTSAACVDITAKFLYTTKE